MSMAFAYFLMVRYQNDKEEAIFILLSIGAGIVLFHHMYWDWPTSDCGDYTIYEGLCMHKIKFSREFGMNLTYAYMQYPKKALQYYNM